MANNLTATDVTGEPYELQRFAPRLPKIDERQQFISNGYVQLEELWRPDFAESLSNEARLVMLSANLPDVEGFKAGAGQGRAKLSTYNTMTLVPILKHLHFSQLPLVRALTGRLLVPAHAWYNFYLNDDSIWLHIDIQGSELVLLTTVFGDVGPLYLHPELQGKSQDELNAIQNDPKWEDKSGQPMAYPRHGLLAVNGNVIPHHRPGLSLPQPAAVAALHYTSLF